MRTVSLSLLVALLVSFSGARSDANELRIERPSAHQRTESPTNSAHQSCCSDDSPFGGKQVSSSREGDCCSSSAGKEGCCSSTSGSVSTKKDQSIFPDLRAGTGCSPQELVVSPSQHFAQWLKLNLHPSLCPFVLCQRQCALTDNPCFPLGVKKGILIESKEGGGCCGGDPVAEQVSSTKNETEKTEGAFTKAVQNFVHLH